MVFPSTSSAQSLSVMESKRYSLTFEYRPSYLHARLKVDVITLEIAVAYINELISELRSSGAKKVVFERQTPAVLSRKDYATIVTIFTTLLPKDVSFAVVDRSPQPATVREVILAETENRHPHICAFESVEEAENWLMTK